MSARVDTVDTENSFDGLPAPLRGTASRGADTATLALAISAAVASAITPVLGPVEFIDDWHFPRDGGRRRHEGNDLIGTTGQPLRAAVDGIVTRARHPNVGTAGVVVSITDADGYRYNYFHLNDDGPDGTGKARAEFRIHRDLTVGSPVRAGQVIGFLGDTGNATGIPHLHFEIRDPRGNPTNPFPSLLAAQRREQCSIGIGPWSTPSAGQLDEPGPAEIAWNVVGPDGARWEITSTGAVRAFGVGALVTPGQGDCAVTPGGLYGTDVGGLRPDSLTLAWRPESVERPSLTPLLGPC